MPAAHPTQALFLPAGVPPPAHALAVDGTVPGAAATYSHWHDAPPVALRGDTSTALLLEAARDPGTWLAPYAVAVLSHIDADGLLALAIACQPTSALRHADLLIGAAEAGDFREWPGAAGFRLLLLLHQLVQEEEQRGGPWQERLCTRAGQELEAWVRRSTLPDAVRDAAVEHVRQALVRLQRQDGVQVRGDARLTTVRWPRRDGHPPDAFLRIQEADDLPPWALAAIVPERALTLLAMETPAGTHYQLEAPRWSWARTTWRRPFPWPDLRPVARALQAEERGGCWWRAYQAPDFAARSYTTLLVSLATDGAWAASSLPVEAVERACRAVLTTATPPAG